MSVNYKASIKKLSCAVLVDALREYRLGKEGFDEWFGTELAEYWCGLAGVSVEKVRKVLKESKTIPMIDHKMRYWSKNEIGADDGADVSLS